MRDDRAAADWASARRRRWSASRIAAALALHALVLGSLTLAIDRVQVPRHGEERTTTLVTVALHAAPPPMLPPVRRQPPAARVSAPAPREAHAPVATRPREDVARPITPPAPLHDEPSPAVAAVTPPASSPRADLSFLNNEATRQAIRKVARGDTLASHAGALTHEEDGSELLAADGTHQGMTRNLPPPPPAQLLAKEVAAAHKHDCLKGDYAGAGMGLLSAPFLLANEALGKCAHKL